MAPKTPEQIAPGVYRVDAIGIPNAISVLLLDDSDGWTLVDTGMHGSALRIQEALATLGAGPDELTRIYLTHHHLDHIGGLSAVRWWATQAQVGAIEHEAQVISGERPLDPPSSAFFRFFARRQQLPTVSVDRVLQEGDSFAGFRVVATPGHTQGHTSLLNDQHGLLFTADAFGSMPFKVRVGVRKFFCTDPAEAQRSAEKLLREEFSTVVFSHGKPLHENAKRRLSEIAARDQYE
ncbi:MAG: MBL fold metallo-hydrolase [Rubrobacter sp.]|nr:MBL fold metallo-hydrolase [Rubrobacter sp.]